MSLRHLATTVFDAGKLKPKYLIKELSNLRKSRIFIQNKYSFFKNLEYSFKTNIHFLSDPGPIIVYPSQWLTHSLTHWLTDWRPCWRLNELTFVDGIKYLSDVDIEMKLRFSCQQLKTSGKACKAGNSCNSCQSWRQWIDLCWWNQISKRCWHWNEIEV